MPNIGPMEIAIVLVIALIVLGPKRLPDVGRSVGRGMREFKNGLTNIGDSDERDRDDDESRPAPRLEAVEHAQPDHAPVGTTTHTRGAA